VRSSSLREPSYGIVSSSNGRKKKRKEERKGGTVQGPGKEDRQEGTGSSTIAFCIKKEWFSLE